MGAVNIRFRVKFSGFVITALIKQMECDWGARALPSPTRLVVVAQHPAQPDRVLVGHCVPELGLGRQHAELGLVVTVLEPVLVQLHL